MLNCPPTALQLAAAKDIYDLLPDLERVWPSWSSGDEQFWEHEWSRHGTCAAAVLGSERAFFKAVLRLHSRLNVQVRRVAARAHPCPRRPGAPLVRRRAATRAARPDTSLRARTPAPPALHRPRCRAPASVPPTRSATACRSSRMRWRTRTA